jgi:hypothetical protein
LARTIVCVKLRFKAGSLDFPLCASEFGNELHTVTQELRVPPAADRRFVRSSATQGTTRAAARVVEACHNAMTSAQATCCSGMHRDQATPVALCTSRVQQTSGAGCS